MLQQQQLTIIAKCSILDVAAVKYYHKLLHLGCCSNPRSASGNEEWTPLSRTIFGWDVKTRLCKMKNLLIMWAGPLIKSIKRSHDLKFRSASCGLSPLYQLCDLALRSPITTVKHGFLLKINSRFKSRFLTNVSNSFMFCLGDLI